MARVAVLNLDFGQPLGQVGSEKQRVLPPPL
jgi:hypothetical protein